ELSPTLLRAAQHDLMLLSRLYHLGADGLRHRCPDAVVLPPLPGDLAGDAPLAPDWSLRQLLDQQQDWSGFVSMLAEHYRSTAMGDLAHGTVFRWLGGGTSGTFKVINHPDPIRLADLVGDERQRELIIRNTKHFLAGLPANNVLLYGDRGTGKSSTVKALVNEFAAQGLRLIEVPRQRMEDFPEIVEILRTQPHKYVLFVDDLSFEEQETTYKDLKALLEGGVEIRPANVVVYATSNRRHLIRERHADRPQPGEEEVHSFDTVQEQLSLADRFGITITFLTPDQEQYLAIVRHLAGQRQLPIAADELRIRALQWASWHNGRSGRSAHQFVDYLAGELLTRATPSALS
ncbi:MAG: ATP-binding protein, partial [Chloroflexi bacterium]|nr:ATP-binding protein [Chloroflexota bacterium]